MRSRTPAPSALLSLVLVAAIAIAIASYHSLLRDITWWLVTFGAAAIVLGVAAGARRLSPRQWVPPVAGLIAVIVAVTLVFVPGSAILGVIPTFDTVGAIVALAGEGGESIATQGIPAEPTQGIVFLLTVGFTLVAILLDALVFVVRRPALTGIPLLLLIAVPSLIDTTVREPVFFVFMAAAYFALILANGSRAQRRLGVTVSAVSIVGALVLSVVLPPVLSDDTVNLRSNGYSTGLNPFINLGQDLRRGTPITAIEYTTDAPKPQYFTLTVLKDFDGDSWKPVERENGNNDLEAIGPAPGRADDAQVTPVTTEVKMGNITGRWLPVPYAPTSVDGLVGDWEWNPESLVLWSTNSNSTNQKFTVTTDAAVPSAQQLYATGTRVPDGLDDYLEVPAELDPIVAQTALDVVGDASSNYEKAIALQAYFRGGDFEYSTEAPVEDGYEGSSAAVIAKFLDEKSGYCVHFASAFAAMARTLDIPARIGVGFTSGEGSLDVANRVTRYTVTTDDLHAWPELYFDTIGWVRFEPTVSRGTVPNYGVLSPDNPATPEDESTSTPTAEPTTNAPTDAPTTTPDEEPEQSAPDTFTVTPTVRSALIWTGIGLLAVLVLLLPAIWRAGRRARRFRHVRDHGSPFEAWSELRDYALDLGLPTSDSETPRAFATALHPRMRAGGVDALARILAAVEAEAFAPDDARRRAGAGDLRTVLVAMRGFADTRARVRARFAPASVIGRRRRETVE